MTLTLRDYQEQAVNNTLASFETNQAVLCVMATGCGKTVIAAHIAKPFADKGRILLLAHREELIFQGKNTLERVTGAKSDIEMGESWAEKSLWGTKIVCSTYQTQIAGRDGGRMNRFNPDDFSLVIADECFVAGTFVGSRMIETIQTGDRVPSWDGTRVVARRVTRTFKNICQAVVEIALSNGRAIVCTPNHPVYDAAQKKYVPAILLDKHSMVIYSSHHDIQINMQRVRSNLHSNMQPQNMLDGVRSESKVETVAAGHSSVHHLRETCGLFRTDRKSTGEKRTGVLFAGLPGSVHASIVFRENGEDQSPICCGPDEEAQSHAESGDASEGVVRYARSGYRESRREWDGSDRAPEVACRRPAMADGVRHPDEAVTGQRLSELLQGRSGEPCCEDGSRSGRKFAQAIGSPATGPEEGSPTCLVGVESVTFHQRRHSSRFDRLCPDGFVYNLEVEQTHTYLANGVVVHNCHHAVSASQRKVLEYYRQNPRLKILGLTATPDRFDEEALGQVFQDVAFEYDIWEAIQGGWLVPVQQQAVYVEGLDFSSVRTTAGDLNGKDLAEILEYEQTLHEMTTPILDLCGDRKTLIFTVTVAQAERMAEILNRHKPDSSEFVCGETPTEYRRSLLERYAASQFQYLANVGVATEGFDEPGIAHIVMARPTKSRSLFSQMVGRGTRTLPGIVDGLETVEARQAAIAASGKPCVTVIDFVGNAGRHKLMHATDVLGGKYSDEVVELAQKNMEKSGKPADITSELVKAEREIDRRRRIKEEAAQRAQIKARSTYSTSKINPFDVLDIVPCREPGWHKGRVATIGQKGCLEKFGVNIPEDLSFVHASQLIDKLIKNSKAGKPSYKQSRLLRRYNYNVDEMSFKDAKQAIDQLAANGWKRPAREKALEEVPF